MSGESFCGERLGLSTRATNVGSTAEALIETPSSSGWICEISILSAGASLIGSRSWVLGGDWMKSEDVSSLFVTQIAVSRGACTSSTRRSVFLEGLKVRLGFLGAGA